MNSNGTPSLRLSDAVARTGVEVVVAVAAAAASAYSAYSQGQTANMAARANAENTRQTAEGNARILELRARQQMAAADYEETRQRERTRFMLAEQRARAGAAGLEMEGSPLEVLAFSAGQAELDALAIRQRGRIDATDTLLQAGQQRISGAQSAGLETWRGAQAATAGTVRAGSEVLQGGWNAWQRWPSGTSKPATGTGVNQ